MKNVIVAALPIGLMGLTGCGVTQPFEAAAAFTAHVLCSQTFVAGHDPDEIFNDYVARTRSARLLSSVLRYHVNRQDREVRVTIAGRLESRAVYRDGRGCTVVHEGAPMPAAIPLETATSSAPDPLQVPAGVVTSADPNIEAAIDRVFAETPSVPYQDVKAVVIVHDGRVIAERYAQGYSPETPMHGWSLAKSITNAMIGVLVRQGRLSIEGPAPVAAWRAQADPRHVITVDELLRQTSGQPFGSAGSGIGRSARMQFGEPDTAAFAAAAQFSSKPGEHWSYTDGNYAILSGMIRDSVGGTAADVARFARREIFAPAGMNSVVQEFDQAGAPMGGSYVFATARDWTRFALLYLNDGLAGNTRVLPEGWVAYSKRPTPQAQLGYGAGFWTNIGGSEGTVRRRSWGAPPDSFFGNGDFGQNLLIVPSEGLIVARFGFSQDADGRVSHRRICTLAAEVIQALHGSS